jgi:hypothetical protein
LVRLEACIFLEESRNAEEDLQTGEGNVAKLRQADVVIAQGIKIPSIVRTPCATQVKIFFSHFSMTSVGFCLRFFAPSNPYGVQKS